MELKQIISGEIVVLLALFIVILLLLIWALLKKIVVVPTLNVSANKEDYFRSEVVTISGLLTSNEEGLEGKSVSVAIQPPSGDAYSLDPIDTNAAGAFSKDWIVPSDALAGEYVVTATAMGVEATTTFTFVPRR